MAGYFALTGQIVGDAGGRLIKTLGDAGLVAFPAEAADAGVLALRSVQSAGREWLASVTAASPSSSLPPRNVVIQRAARRLALRQDLLQADEA